MASCPRPGGAAAIGTAIPLTLGGLAFIRRTRELGFTLDEVRALLSLAGGGAEPCLEARELRDVRARIADLKRMARTLAAHIRACDAGDSAACPLIESLQQQTF